MMGRPISFYKTRNNKSVISYKKLTVGFIDPIEVTSFGMPDGEYKIVSGHRRRAAGQNCGMEIFPCLIRSFNNEHEMQNYVLLANSHRDSSKDPLLFCTRYRLHEEYLTDIDYKGNIRDEVAKRLGLSVQQADRYAQFNKIVIKEIWDYVREEKIGMSSVLGMAVHTPDEQQEIFLKINSLLEEGVKLNRVRCESLIQLYPTFPKYVTMAAQHRTLHISFSVFL